MVNKSIFRLAVLLSLCTAVWAQQNEVAGVVQDPSGAAVPAADVTVRGADGNAGTSKKATTGADGQFTFSLPPGSYRLEVAAKGFAIFSSEVTVGGGSDTRHLTFRLALGSASSRVNVTANSGYVAEQSATGTKTDTPIIETPQSISVVTRQQMDDQQPQSTNEALRYTPGVVPESNGVSSNFWSGSSLLLRGFLPEIYQDGLEDDLGGNDLLDPYFYQSVNILSGPASVLYGQASPGGIIDEEMKKPTDTPIHEVQFGIGNYGRYEGQFDFSGPIDGNDHFLYRLTAVGFTENTQTRFVNAQRLAIAPSFTWKPNEDTSFTILANYTWNPAIGQYAYVPAQGSVLPNPNGKIPTDFYVGDPNFNKTDQKSAQIGYEFKHRFGHNWSFEQDFRYTTNQNYANMIWPLSLESDLETLDRYSFIRHVNFNSFLIDNRIKREFTTGSVKQTVVVGLNYTHYYENWKWGENDDIPTINVFAPVYYQNIQGPSPAAFEVDQDTANQIGVYAQDQISIRHWRFLLGAREDWVNYRYTNGGPYEQYNNKLTWRAGLVYLFDNGLAPYFSYSTSFQPDVGITATGAALPPTFGEQYEAGIKYQQPHSRNMITGAIYNLAQNNVGVMDPQNPNFEIAIGQIRSRGFEFQDHLSLTSNLDLIATYTYTDSKYTKSTQTDTGINGDTSPIQGRYQYGVPPQIASLWANYTLHSGLARGFGFGGGVRYVGFSYGDDVNSFKVPAFTLVDATLHYDLGELNHALKGYRIQVNANNLFDKSYVASCFSSDGCYFGLRRTVYATMKFDW